MALEGAAAPDLRCDFAIRVGAVQQTLGATFATDFWVSAMDLGTLHTR